MVNCPLCNSEKKTAILTTKDNDARDLKSKGIFKLVKCKNCGLDFIDNMPSKKDMAKYYQNDYYAKNDIGNRIMDKLIMASRLNKLPKKKIGLIMDYGCGNGDFLLRMKQNGWKIAGVEFSGDARHIASKKTGIKMLSEAEFYKLNKKFDVITMWHVLEHIEEPNKLLKKLRTLLTKNGLLIVSVPNIESCQFYLFGKNTFHLDVPRHVAQYSPRTISILLKKNGFKVVGFNHYSIEYNPFGFVQGFLNSIGCEFNFLYNIIKRGYKRRVSVPKFIYSLFATFILLPFLIIASVPITYIESFLGHGASFVVYAKK